MKLIDYSRIIKNPCVYSSPDKSSRGRFKPQGNFQFSGPRINPLEWKSQDAPYMARILVGFNVGEKPAYSMSDLIPIVRNFLRLHGLPEDSSFVYQKGVYTHSKDGKVIQEDGAQVIILKVPYTAWDNVTSRRFPRLMQWLAETIATQLQQEEVIVETSKGGKVIATFGMSGKKSKRPKLK